MKEKRGRVDRCVEPIWLTLLKSGYPQEAQQIKIRFKAEILARKLRKS